MNVILAILTVSLPGFVASFLNCRHNGIVNRKKLLVQWGFYCVMINLLLYCGLYVIGKSALDFFDMSTGFQVKCLLLSLGFALFCSCMGFPKLKAGECLDRVKQVFPSAFVLTVTYAVFSPSALFLNNIDEFRISYFEIVPIVFVSAFLFFVFLCFISLCLVKRTDVQYYIALVFGVTIGLYLQTNFLNPALPTLDGTPVDWTVYIAESRVNVLCWGLCLLLPVIFTFFQSGITEKGISVLSWFFSAVQIVSLVVMICFNPVDNPENYGLSKVDEFTIGAQDNIVIFIVDSLQASAMEEYLESGAYPEGRLDDFTFFHKAVSGGSPTYIGLVTLMTGSEYDPLESGSTYFSQAWNDTRLYDDLHRNGYDVRFFTTDDSLPGVSGREADNYKLFSENVQIENPVAFAVQLYKLTNFYSLPLFLKKHFILATEEMTDLLKRSVEAYEFDDAGFYQELQAAKDVEVSYDKAFRLYHFRGVHTPYMLDENLESVMDGSLTEQQPLQGNMKEIYLYMDQMKRAGVYDSSMIIIAGDHGRHQEGNLGANAAVLIKRPYESHPIAHSGAPIHFRNVTSTMAMMVTENYAIYGPSIYDITEKSDVERMHTVDESIRERNTVDDAWEGAYECRFIVPQDPAETEEFQIWDPYKINRIVYQLGEKINFGENGGYAEQINYRLYKEKNAAVASNELSICFALTEHPGTDLTFHFTYDKIYGEKQEVRIYINGNRTGTITCTPDQVGSDCSLVIPQSAIVDDLLVMRMVFPNAVTPNQLDREDADVRILSVAFDSMWITE